MKIKKFQQGGAMPVEPTAPTQDPMQMLVEAAVQALETQDPNLAMQVCQMLVELVMGPAPVGAPVEQPVFKKGGVLRRK